MSADLTRRDTQQKIITQARETAAAVGDGHPTTATHAARTCGGDRALPRSEILEQLVVLAAQRPQRLAVFKHKLGELLR